MTIIRATLILLFALNAAAATAQAPAAALATPEGSGLPIKVTDVEGVEARLYLDGRVYLAGQPNEAALAKLKERGVTAVINVRTPAEMSDPKLVPFDEAAAVAALGMEYVQVPLNGRDFPYTTDAVDRFAAVLGRHSGPVVLHCASAGRVSYLWAAYLIRHRNFTLADALARGEAVGITPNPLEGLTGRAITLAWEDAPGTGPGKE